MPRIACGIDQKQKPAGCRLVMREIEAVTIHIDVDVTIECEVIVVKPFTPVNAGCRLA